MTKETIKNFLKPTKAKIALTVLVFIGTIWFINQFPFTENFSTLHISKKVFYCILVPDIYLSENIIFPILETKINTDPFDIWFPYWFLFLFPIRIICEYLLSCVVCMVLQK